MSLEPSKVERLYRSYRICLGYSIRSAGEDDLPAIQWFRSVTGLGELPEGLLDGLRSGEKPLLLAELNGHPIGQIQVTLDGELAILEGLRVLEPMRGFGVAQHLVDEAEKLCGRTGCKIATIAVPLDNPEARELFQSMGYSEAGGDRMEKDIRWKSCRVPEDDIPAEELCRCNIDSAIG